MSTDFFKSFSDAIEAEYQAHLSPAVKARLADPLLVSYAEWKQMRLNSWERERIMLKLTSDALIQIIISYAEHIPHPKRATPSGPTSTYEGTLLNVLLPLLTRHCQRMLPAVETCQLIAVTANEHGWNGTDNSKLLEVFIEDELTELANLRKVRP